MCVLPCPPRLLPPTCQFLRPFTCAACPSGVRMPINAVDSALLNMVNVDIRNCSQIEDFEFLVDIHDTRFVMQGRSMRPTEGVAAVGACGRRTTPDPKNLPAAAEPRKSSSNKTTRRRLDHEQQSQRF